MDGDFRKHFTVQLYIRFFEPSGHNTVRFAGILRRRRQARNPQAAELPFFLPPADIGVVSGVKRGFFGRPEFALAPPFKTFCLLEDVFSAFVCGGTAFDSCHEYFCHSRPRIEVRGKLQRESILIRNGSPLSRLPAGRREDDAKASLIRN